MPKCLIVLPQVLSDLSGRREDHVKNGANVKPRAEAKMADKSEMQVGGDVGEKGQARRGESRRKEVESYRKQGEELGRNHGHSDAPGNRGVACQPPEPFQGTGR